MPSEHYFVNERLLPLATDETTLIFHPHAARTGGRTMRQQVLTPALGAEHIYCRQHVPHWKNWRDLTDDDLDGYRAYTDLRDFEPIKLRRALACIGVIRHPLYRMVSLYGFIRGNRDHRHYNQAQRYPLEEFYRSVSEEHPGYFRNVQARRLCGEPDAQLALETIRERYIAVGFTNQLWDFAHGLCSIFGWPPIELERLPPDAERYEHLISPGFRQVVLEENAEDMAVYDAVLNGTIFTTGRPSFTRRVAGLVPSYRKLRTQMSQTLKSAINRRNKTVSGEEQKRIRRELRGRVRLERARQVAAAAPPGTPVCNLCGNIQVAGRIDPICPNCAAGPRQRSFPALLDTVLKPLFAANDWSAALIFPMDGIERMLLEPNFKAVTIPQIFNLFVGNRIKADIRTLAPFADSSFDFIQDCCEIEERPETSDALHSIARTLRSRGAFCFHVSKRRLEVGDNEGGESEVTSLLHKVGLSHQTFEFPDPLTGCSCTWFLCQKTSDQVAVTV